jgi:hypothetical protein
LYSVHATILPFNIYVFVLSGLLAKFCNKLPRRKRTG